MIPTTLFVSICCLAVDFLELSSLLDYINGDCVSQILLLNCFYVRLFSNFCSRRLGPFFSQRNMKGRCNFEEYERDVVGLKRGIGDTIYANLFMVPR